MKFLKLSLIGLLLNHNLSANNFNFYSKMRNIIVSGLIVDSKTMLPVSEALIYDEHSKVIGSTNHSGFFSGQIDVPIDEDINFKILVKKSGYESYTQKEHWANLKGNINVIYYFGINRKSSNSKPFSEIVLNKRGNSYEVVKEGFNSLREKINFDNKIENAKIGNDNVVFDIDNNTYLISDTGWIKLNSTSDLVSIDGKKILPVKEINFHLKRARIKKMSPLDSKDASFEIYTY